jgi:hypothetical protein
MIKDDPTAMTIEDLWERLTDLSQKLPIDDNDTESAVSASSPDDGAADDEQLDSDDDDQIPESFVFTRFILRQCLRFQEYVEEQFVGAARESWALIVHHSTQCPGVIKPSLERSIGEVLDELVSRSPIDERQSSSSFSSSKSSNSGGSSK